MKWTMHYDISIIRYVSSVTCRVKIEPMKWKTKKILFAVPYKYPKYYQIEERKWEHIDLEFCNFTHTGLEVSYWNE